MPNIVKLLRRRYWTTVVVATVLPAVLAGIFENLMSGGTSGWVPFWAGLTSGVLTAVVLLIIQKPEQANHDRIVINKSVQELINLRKEHTDFVSKPIIKRYIGTWMREQGRIRDVIEHENSMQVIIGDSISEPMLVLHFEKNMWLDKLKILDLAESISVLGQISSITRHWVELRNCEIVDSDAPH